VRSELSDERIAAIRESAQVEGVTLGHLALVYGVKERIIRRILKNSAGESRATPQPLGSREDPTTK
jgi:hypothetical protein